MQYYSLKTALAAVVFLLFPGPAVVEATDSLCVTGTGPFGNLAPVAGHFATAELCAAAVFSMSLRGATWLPVDGTCQAENDHEVIIDAAYDGYVTCRFVSPTTTAAAPSAGDDPVFTTRSRDVYSVHGVPKAIFNLISTLGLSVNSMFHAVPKLFRTPDITGNVLGNVGISLCVNDSQQEVAMNANGTVTKQGKLLGPGTHTLGVGTNLTLLNHACDLAPGEELRNCEFISTDVPAGKFLTAHRQLVVSHGATTVEVNVNFLMLARDAGEKEGMGGMFRFLEVTLKNGEAPMHGLLGQNSLTSAAEMANQQLTVGVFGKQVTPDQYQGGAQGEGMIEGVWTDYIELDSNLHGQNHAFSQYQC